MTKINSQPISTNAKKHLITSLTIVIVLTAVLAVISPVALDLFANPQKYILGLFPDLVLSNFQAVALSISWYITIVLIGYIIYLLLTSRTRAELIANLRTEKLSASKAELEELYENAPVPYLTINKDGEIKACNKATLRFFGVVVEEIYSKNIFGFITEEEKDLADKLKDFFRMDSPINNQEVRLVTKKYGTRWVSLSIFLTRDFLTEEKNGLVTVFDITDQKQLDQAKTEFVSLTSHQLRTPLATIKWYAEMLESPDFGTLNDKQKDYLKRMASVNSEMIDLVETLLNVSKIEIGTLTINKQPTNVPALIDGILVELASQIDKHKIQFVKNYNNALQNINSDPKLLRIVIQNLITNAIKYNKEGGTVTINLEEGATTGQSSISVSDTGLGIPKDQQNRVFSKLFRAKNVQDVEGGQSTGLGLYLVKSVIEALGGSIGFTSEEGTGTTFILKL